MILKKIEQLIHSSDIYDIHFVYHKIGNSVLFINIGVYSQTGYRGWRQKGGSWCLCWPRNSRHRYLEELRLPFSYQKDRK